MECTERNLITHVLGPSITCNLIMHVLTTYHMKLAQSTALEQKRFNLRLLLPAFCNFWLSLVLMTGNLE